MVFEEAEGIDLSNDHSSIPSMDIRSSFQEVEYLPLPTQPGSIGIEPAGLNSSLLSGTDVK